MKSCQQVSGQRQRRQRLRLQRQEVGRMGLGGERQAKGKVIFDKNLFH